MSTRRVRNRRRLVRGFTLIELLVALVVFSALSVMAYGGLRTLMTTRAQTEAASERLSQLQTAFLLLQQDLEQVVARPIRNSYGDEEPALMAGSSSDHLLAFSRGGWRNFLNPAQSNLRRIAYRLEDGKLRRLHWPALDRAQDDDYQEMVLLEAVESIEFSFLGDKDWTGNWPSSGGKQKIDSLPRAVEINLRLEGWGDIRRLFTIPH